MVVRFGADEEYDREGRLHFPSKAEGQLRLKMYLDESLGRSFKTFADDIPPINSQAAEALGYPTQKPLPLLERIIKASSNENDIVLDAFCGCGTALVAAQKLKRQWIGIDISPTSCRVMAKRLKKDCGLKEDEKLWAIGRGSSCAICQRQKKNCENIRHSNLKTGQSLRLAASQTRRKWAISELMAAFTPSPRCRHSVRVKQAKWNSWTSGIRCK